MISSKSWFTQKWSRLNMSSFIRLRVLYCLHFLADLLQIFERVYNYVPIRQFQNLHRILSTYTTCIKFTIYLKEKQIPN